MQGPGAGAPLVDVLDECGARRLAVAPPKLGSVDLVVGGEKQSAVDVGEHRGTGTIAARHDLAHESRAETGPLAAPELFAVSGVGGDKK